MKYCYFLLIVMLQLSISNIYAQEADKRRKDNYKSKEKTTIKPIIHTPVKPKYHLRVTSDYSCYFTLRGEQYFINKNEEKEFSFDIGGKYIIIAETEDIKFTDTYSGVTRWYLDKNWRKATFSQEVDLKEPGKYELIKIELEKKVNIITDGLKQYFIDKRETEREEENRKYQAQEKERKRMQKENDIKAFKEAFDIDSESSYKKYTEKFPNGLSVNEAVKRRSFLSQYDSFMENGNNYFLNHNFNKALTCYKDALSANNDYRSNYPNTNNHKWNLRNDSTVVAINNTEEEIDFLSFKFSPTISKGENYLNKYKKYMSEVTACLCPMYFDRGVQTFNSKDTIKGRNPKIASKSDFLKSSNMGCHITESNNYISKIEEIEKIEKWNNGFNNKNYYSYIFETNNLSSYSSDFSQGISLFTLRNGSWGYYFSYRVSNAFYSKKETLDDFPASDYMVSKQPSKSISSISVSMGTTKKIFRPVFGYFGLGVGTNSLVQDYSVTNLHNNTKSKTQIIDKKNRSWILSPEAGLVIDLWGASILTGIKYPIALNKTAGYDYKGLIYTVGVGFGVNNSKEIYRRNWWYLAYNFDLGYPSKNFSLSKEEYLSNKGLIGFSWGFLNNTGVGFYMSYRSNIFFYRGKDNLNDHMENNIYKDYIIDDDQRRISKTFLTLGITKKIQYPLWFYAGLGASYYSESNQLTLQPHYEISFQGGSVLTEKEIVWAKNPDSVIWGLNPEIGITLNLWGVVLRAGINHPLPFKYKLKVDQFSPQFSFSIGGAGGRY